MRRIDTGWVEVFYAPVRRIVLFWLPLAATWGMMALELPYVAAIV
ncbi:MAG: hypothetical protein QOH21_1217, partial [Acidobacteriota bacterium]|nr:hypothetical protein [Acidobacteriota bacterium]